MEEEFHRFGLPKMELMLYGPAASHNHPCCVCRKNHSVLDLSRGVMEPCWDCQKQGYQIVKQKPRWMSRFWKSLEFRP